LDEPFFNVTGLNDMKYYSKIDVHCSAPQGESVESPGIISPLMRIALVAPHSASQNGIGNYTARLIEELRLQDPRCSIIAPDDLLPGKSWQEPGDWRGRELPPYWPSVLLEAIDAAHPQVVHIQFGLYIGHGHDLTRFLAELRARRIPCVVTLHCVWPPTILRRWPAHFYRLLAANVEQVIVHQRAGTLTLLQEHGIPTDRIAVIPHGTWTSEDIAPAEIPDTMDMAGRRVVLFVGNIFRRKGLHIVIQAFPAVVQRIPEACLLVVGNERTNNFLDRLYRLWLHARMRPGLKEGWLIRRAEYVPNDELWARITAAEVAVFPYLRRYGSASGIFHRVLAAGRPALCSNVPTFAEAIDAWGESLIDLFPPPGDVGAWSRALIRILSDEPFRRRAMEVSTILGRETSWPLVAREHLQLYRSLLPPAPIPDEK
jgi:glycosyltransferase involved in cell wall biosynthesis